MRVRFGINYMPTAPVAEVVRWARFDEESNIEWARALEREGVHVVYGLVGLKGHAKLALVVRREGGAIRKYVHLGTGNYNPATARLYTDLSLLTTDESIGNDAVALFNRLTGYSEKNHFAKLAVAPLNLRARLEELIRREMDFARGGAQGHVIVKSNAIDDPEMIALLDQAFPGWCPRGTAGPGPVLSAAGRGRRQRQHPRDQHRGPVSRAQPHLLFPQRRGRGALGGSPRPWPPPP